MPMTAILISNCAAASIYLLFFGMTTEVEGDRIKIRFGIGVISKTIELANIAAAVAVKSPWYYGWGIRIIPNGILYNIAGSCAVEIRFTTSSGVIRIGTTRPEELRNAILSDSSRIVENW